MSRSRRIIINIASNVALHGVGVGVSFLMVPLLLHYFGKEVFGLNAYVAGIVLLFTFVSSAISMSLIKFVPETLATHDYDAFNRHLSATLWFSALANIPAGILIACFPYYGSNLFNLPPHLIGLVRQVFAVVGAGVAFQFMLPVINGVYYGLEMFALRNGIQLISVSSNVLGYFVVVAWGGTLMHYVMFVQSGIVLTMLVAFFVLIRRLPCRLKWSPPGSTLVRQTLSMNLFLVVNQAAHSLLYSADKVILQKMFGSISVAEYQVARQTDIMMQSIISLPLSAIMPSIASAYASGDGAYVKKVNYTGSLFYCAVMMPPLVVLFCMYEAFISLWVGGDFERTVLAGRLFVVAVVAATPLKVFSHSLVANGRVKELGVAKVGYALINVPLSIICAMRFGFIGVVIPTVAYWLLVHPALLLWLASRQGLARRMLVNMVLVLCMLPIGSWIHSVMPIDPFYSWFTFSYCGFALYFLILLVYVTLLSLFTSFTKDLSVIIGRIRSVS